jgi:hypothetical protein
MRLEKKNKIAQAKKGLHMAVKNSNGHAVTNMAGQHHQDTVAAQPQFMPTQGPADHGGMSKKKVKFPPAK